MGSAHHKPKIIVGFALEDKDLRLNAERKMREKHLDMIVANTPGAIGAEASTLHIKPAGSDWIEIGHMQKTRSARHIIRLIENLAKEDRVIRARHAVRCAGSAGDAVPVRPL